MTGRVSSLVHLRRPAAPARAAPAASAPPARLAVMLLIPVATLLVVGIGAILSSSSVVAFRETGDRLFYFKRQVMFAAAGVGLLLVTARVPYRLYKKWALPILAVAIAGLLATLAIGEVRGGAQRWIAVGPLTVQPSEFAKFAVVVYLAALLSRKADLLGHFGHFVGPVITALGTVGLLVMAQPDMGTTLIISAGALAVMAASRAPLVYVLTVAIAGGSAALAMARSSAYQWARITAFLDPAADPLGSGFQATQSLVAIGTGGWFGVGLGASRARWSFLPNAHTDFIFAIIGEETGFAGAIVIVALFAAFAVGGTVVALRAPDPFGRMLAAGIVTWLSAQALINVGGVTALLPITGVPLPFVSFGGTSLLVSLAAVGVLVNVAQAGARER